MKTLSEFLEIEEGVEFKVEYLENTYVIRNNKLWSIGDKLMGTVNTPLNDIVGRKITILPKQILTDEEKEYLKTVIKPFKEKIDFIRKWEKEEWENKEFIVIGFKNIDEEPMYFPTFKKGKYYKGLELGKSYTLQQLGLEE